MASLIKRHLSCSVSISIGLQKNVIARLLNIGQVKKLYAATRDLPLNKKLIAMNGMTMIS